MAEERKAPSQRQGNRDTSELGTHGGPGVPAYPGRASEGRSERDRNKELKERPITPDSTVHSR